MLRAIYRLLSRAQSTGGPTQAAAAPSGDKAILRAKLLAVAIARTTAYADLAH